MVYEMDDRPADLGQIVGWDIGGHAHGYPRGAVQKKIGQLGRQNGGLLQGAVVVGGEVHGILLNILEHLPGDLGEADLGVAHGRRRIAVYGPEVSLAVDERIAHGKGLGQAHNGIIYGHIPVGMVLAHDVAHHPGRFLVGLIMGHALLIHGIEYAPVYRLEPVSYIRQSPSHDHTHGIIDVGGLHLLSDAHLNFRQLPPQVSD